MLKITVYTIGNPIDYNPGEPIECATVECAAPVLFRSFESDGEAMAYAELMREETGHNIARYITRD